MFRLMKEASIESNAEYGSWEDHRIQHFPKDRIRDDRHDQRIVDTISDSARPTEKRTG